MKNKIIIDNIDVSECVYALTPKKQCPNKPMPYAKETSCPVCKEKITQYNFCKKNPSCYFKQLKRKEQEYKRLKEDYAELLKRHDDSFEQFKELIQNCEELKKYLIDIFKALDIPTTQSILGRNCIEFYAIRSDTAKNRIKQYKQEFDEIEEIVKRTSGECFYHDINDCETCDMNFNCSSFNLRKIKHIINKTKEN